MKRGTLGAALEFRKRAIALAEELGASHAARRLGLKPNTLQTWVKRDAIGPRMKKKDTPEARAALLAELEIKQLRRENKELKQANLILKEVASFFSKDPLVSDARRSLSSTLAKPIKAKKP